MRSLDGGGGRWERDDPFGALWWRMEGWIRWGGGIRTRRENNEGKGREMDVDRPPSLPSPSWLLLPSSSSISSSKTLFNLSQNDWYHIITLDLRSLSLSLEFSITWITLFCSSLLFFFFRKLGKVLFLSFFLFFLNFLSSFLSSCHFLVDGLMDWLIDKVINRFKFSVRMFPHRHRHRHRLRGRGRSRVWGTSSRVGGRFVIREEFWTPPPGGSRNFDFDSSGMMMEWWWIEMRWNDKNVWVGRKFGAK